MTWTGEEIVVFGGSSFLCPPTAGCARAEDPPHRDGAAFDPQTGQWRQIAKAPLPIPDHTPTAADQGDVYALVRDSSRTSGEVSATLLRYRVTADAWDQHRVPAAESPHHIVGSDVGVFVYSGTDEFGEGHDLLFDTEASSWSALPDDPLGSSFDRHMVWHAGSLYLFAKKLTPTPGGASGPALVHAAVLEGGQWEELPSGDTIGFSSTIIHDNQLVSPELGCADGGETNNYGRCITYGAIFDTSNRTWAPLPAVPDPGEDALSSGALTTDEVLITSLGHHALDLRSSTWFELPDIDAETDDASIVQRNVAGVGPYGFAFGGARFDPETPGGVLLGDAWLWDPLDQTPIDEAFSNQQTLTENPVQEGDRTSDVRWKDTSALRTTITSSEFVVYASGRMADTVGLGEACSKLEGVIQDEVAALASAPAAGWVIPVQTRSDADAV